MAHVLPAQFTATMSKSARRGRIFVDYLRNARGATAVAALSTRARPGATVSMPLAWDELAHVYPTDFTLHTVPDRLDAEGDAWAGILEARQNLAETVGAVAEGAQ
jgi:bifunctional non-homologous end joining protein LigD